MKYMPACLMTLPSGAMPPVIFNIICRKVFNNKCRGRLRRTGVMRPDHQSFAGGIDHGGGHAERPFTRRMRST
jgi:hypothetical protein